MSGTRSSPASGPARRTVTGSAAPWNPAQGLRCNPAKLLLDPYTRAVTGTIPAPCPSGIYLDGRDDPDRAEDGTLLVDDDFLVLVNARWEPLDCTVPITRPDAAWQLAPGVPGYPWPPEDPYTTRFAELFTAGDLEYPIARCAAEVAARIPGCRQIAAPGADHLLPLRVPDLIAALTEELAA